MWVFDKDLSSGLSARDRDKGWKGSIPAQGPRDPITQPVSTGRAVTSKCLETLSRTDSSAWPGLQKL